MANKNVGVAFWLMIMMGAALTIYSATILLVLISIANLIRATALNLQEAYYQFNLSHTFLEIVNFFVTLCFTEMHWAFAMKYWSLAFKLKLLQQRQEID